MTQQSDVMAIIKGLGDLDDKLLSHAGVQHIPSILDSDELPEALIYDGVSHFLVATDRRVIHIATSFWKSNVQKVDSYAYDTMLSFVAPTSLFETAFTIMTEGGTTALSGGKKQGRERFARVVNERLRGSPLATQSTPQAPIQPIVQEEEPYISPKDQAIARVIRLGHRKNQAGGCRAAGRSLGRRAPRNGCCRDLSHAERNTSCHRPPDAVHGKRNILTHGGGLRV